MIQQQIETGSAWYALSVDRRGLRLRDLTGSIRPSGTIPPPKPHGFPVEEILTRHGLRPFIPVESIFIRRNKYRPNEKRRVKRALLPGMVFVNLPDRGVNWYSLLSAPMVYGVFGFHGMPYRFDEDDMNKLVAISADLRQPEYYRPMPTRRGYEVGDEVVDLTGTFEGTFKVVEIRDETAAVLAPFFGDVRRIQMRAANLAKAAE